MITTAIVIAGIAIGAIWYMNAPLFTKKVKIIHKESETEIDNTNYDTHLEIYDDEFVEIEEIEPNFPELVSKYEFLKGKLSSKAASINPKKEQPSE